MIEGNGGGRNPPEPKATSRLRMPRFAGYWWIIAMLFSAFGIGVGSGIGLGFALRSDKCST